MTDRYFVWVSGLRGPEAQIWSYKDMTQEGRKIKTLADPVKLHPKDDRSLDQLKMDYPHGQQL